MPKVQTIKILSGPNRYCLNRVNRDSIRAAKKPANVEAVVARRAGKVTDVGLLDPPAANRAIAPAGISWRLDVFRARNMHIESDATFLSSFND